MSAGGKGSPGKETTLMGRKVMAARENTQASDKKQIGRSAHQEVDSEMEECMSNASSKFYS